MAALIGPARTRLVFMAGARLSADEALNYGLIDRIVEVDGLMDAARGLCADTLSAPPEIARKIKEMTR